MKEAEAEKERLLEEATKLKKENEEIKEEIRRQNQRGWPSKGLSSGNSSNLVSGLAAQIQAVEKQTEEKKQEILSTKRSHKYIIVQQLEVSFNWPSDDLKSVRRLNWKE